MSERTLPAAVFASVAAAVAAAGALSATRGIEIDYATSYEKSPGPSFVGYAGILFSHP